MQGSSREEGDMRPVLPLATATVANVCPGAGYPNRTVAGGSS